MSVKLGTPNSYSILKLVKEREHLFFLKLCWKSRGGGEVHGFLKRCYCCRV